MTGILIFLRANRWAQFALAGAIAIIAFLIWLGIHDRGVIKRENEALNEAAREKGAEARNYADDQQEFRDEEYVISKEGLDNSSDARTYLERLRAAQSGVSPPPTR